jgi:hypothetical protein
MPGSGASKKCCLSPERSDIGLQSDAGDQQRYSSTGPWSLFSPVATIPAGFKRNQCVTLGRLSVHSQNDVAGTRQRHSAFNQPRQ